MLLNSCSPINAYTRRDLVRVQEMAEKYELEGLKICAEYLHMVIGEKDDVRKEDVDGLLSLATKYYLLNETNEHAEQLFYEHCEGVAAVLVLQAAKALKR